MSTSVKDSCYTFEAFLTRSVPNLEFTNFAIDGSCETSEFDSDSDLMFGLEFIVLHSAHQATLANTGITNDDQFEKVILCSDGLVSDDFERGILKLLNFFLLHILNIYIYLYS